MAAASTSLPTSSPSPYYSIVIPVYNEETVLPQLMERLIPAALALGKPYEVVFVNDGSRDGTLAMLEALHANDPIHIKVVDLGANVGQYQAIVAGFAHARGTYVIVMDADLQNYPEDMSRLVPAMDQGTAYVGSFRESRNDQAYRDLTSRTNNALRKALTKIDMTDHGCMLRAFHREVVEGVLAANVTSPFLTLEAYKFAKTYAEVPVRHADRAAGTSKYNIVKLVKIHFDWMTHFSELPLHIATLSGAIVAVTALGGLVYGVVDDSGLAFVGSGLALIGGAILMALGILGSYVARIYKAVMQQAPYVVRKFYG